MTDFLDAMRALTLEEQSDSGLREIRTGDLRCPLCGAGPGEVCIAVAAATSGQVAEFHFAREFECRRLAKRGWRWREVDSTDSQLHSAERTPPCRKRTWCCKPEHSEDEPCEEVPRRDIPRSDFGPKAAEKRRWG